MNTEFLQGGIRMEQSDSLFRLSTDSVLLADFAAGLGTGSAVCDLCAGGGAVGLLLLSKGKRCHVTAVELQPQACALAQRNIALNALEDRMSVIQGDLREIRNLLPANGFDTVVCNPPYFPAGAGGVAKGEAFAVARTEKLCTLGDVCAAAQWLLHTGGSFYLVHRPERLADIIWELRSRLLEPKCLRFIRHSPAHPVCLMLMKAVMGGKPGLTYQPELILFAPDGSPSPEYRTIYHMEGD